MRVRAFCMKWMPVCADFYTVSVSTDTDIRLMARADADAA